MINRVGAPILRPPPMIAVVTDADVNPDGTFKVPFYQLDQVPAEDAQEIQSQWNATKVTLPPVALSPSQPDQTQVAIEAAAQPVQKASISPLAIAGAGVAALVLFMKMRR